MPSIDGELLFKQRDTTKFRESVAEMQAQPGLQGQEQMATGLHRVMCKDTDNSVELLNQAHSPAWDTVFSGNPILIAN